MKTLVDIKFGKNRRLVFKTSVRDRIMEATKVLEEVINHDLFKSRVKEFKWTDKVGKEHANFHMSNGFTNEEILRMILSGKDKFNTTEDGDIDVFIHPYRANKKKVGYTLTNTYKTWINLKWLKSVPKSRPERIAGNLLHEYCHNLGFSHDINGKKVKHFENTVPYKCGKFVVELYPIIKEIVSEPEESETTEICNPSDTDYPFSHFEELNKVIDHLDTEIEFLKESILEDELISSRKEALYSAIQGIREVQDLLISSHPETNQDVFEQMENS